MMTWFCNAFFPTESEFGGMNLHFAKLILPNPLSGVAVDVSACFPYIRMLWGVSSESRSWVSVDNNFTYISIKSSWCPISRDLGWKTLKFSQIFCFFGETWDSLIISTLHPCRVTTGTSQKTNPCDQGCHSYLSMAQHYRTPVRAPSMMSLPRGGWTHVVKGEPMWWRGNTSSCRLPTIGANFPKFERMYRWNSWDFWVQIKLN